MEEQTQLIRRDKESGTSDLDGLLAELAASGLSIAEFARRREMKPWRLYEGQRRRMKARQPCRAARSTSGSLIPVEIHDQSERSQPLELILSSGHRLLVPTGFDEALLRRLMGVLASC